VFQQRLSDGGEKLSIENGKGNSIPKQNVMIPARYMEYILHVKNCRHGDDANSEVEAKKFRLCCNYGY